MTELTTDKKETITIEEIKKYLCPTANDKEAQVFLQLCKSLGANPWLKDVHMIKYGNAPAQMVIGIGYYLKAAQSHPKYRGHKSWIENEGTDMKACAEVYVEGYQCPIYCEVDRSEYDTKKSMWQKAPKTMLKKTALSQCLRQAFSDLFSATYTEEEVAEMIDVSPKKEQKFKHSSELGKMTLKPLQEKSENIKKIQEKAKEESAKILEVKQRPVPPFLMGDVSEEEAKKYEEYCKILDGQSSAEKLAEIVPGLRDDFKDESVRDNFRAYATDLYIYMGGKKG